MDGQKADLVFTDAPYDVKINGNVCGLGTVKHHKFPFARGEMSRTQFTAFLSETLGKLASLMRDGAITFFCMGLAPHGQATGCRRLGVHLE